MFKRIPEICGASFLARSRFAMAALPLFAPHMDHAEIRVGRSGAGIEGNHALETALG